MKLPSVIGAVALALPLCAQVQTPTATVPTPRAQTAAPRAPGTLNNPPVTVAPPAVGQPAIGGAATEATAPSQNVVTDRASAAQRLGIPLEGTAGAVAPAGTTPGWITDSRRIAPSAPAAPRGLRIGTSSATPTTGTTILPNATTAPVVNAGTTINNAPVTGVVTPASTVAAGATESTLPA